MVNIIPGPFTFEGKQAAVQKEVKENYETYFAHAVKARMWFADRLPERNEMAKYGHMVSENTKEILLGFLGVESFVDDYVFAGINAAGDNLATSSLYLQWGWEERRHGQTFRHSLIDSGLYTQQFIDKYLDDCREEHWTFENQTGYEETPLLAAAYAIFQERQTRWNYTNVRRILWKEYGSPTDSNGKHIHPAIAGAIRYPETDEGAHEANFTNITRIYMKYFPDQALDALLKVSAQYRMPIVQLPNGDEFVRCVLAAGLGNPKDVINQIMNPALQRMGLNDRSSLRKAVRNFRLLPEDAIVHLQGKPLSGTPEDPAIPIYEMLPSGDFSLKQAGAEIDVTDTAPYPMSQDDDDGTNKQPQNEPE